MTLDYVIQVENGRDLATAIIFFERLDLTKLFYIT